METLNLSKNQLDSIPLLASNVIRSLTMDQNQIQSVQMLQAKSSLQVLRLDNNRIADARPLNNLNGLTYLDLRFNQLATDDFRQRSPGTTLISRAIRSAPGRMS